MTTARWGGTTSRRHLTVLVFALYAVASILLFGRGVLSHPQTHVVGDAGADKTIFMWALRWWPYSTLHGHDPFAANVVWVPHGIDLAWVTSIPFLSYVLWPLTATAGPVLSYNVGILLAPAAGATVAYALARRLTQAFAPAVAAGWLFGFSAYEYGHLIGHLNLATILWIPLAALLCVKYGAREIARARFVWLLALVLVAQFLTSSEIYLDLLIVTTIVLTSFALFDRQRRGEVREIALSGAAAVGVSLIVVSPYLWHAFISSGTENAPLRSPFSESTDLANFAVPTRLLWVQLPGASDIASRFTATGAERGGYLGVPLIALAVLWVWRTRRSPTTHAVVAAVLALTIATVGSEVRLAGHSLLPAPWRVFAALPLTRTILPVRFTVFLTLAFAMIAASAAARQVAGRFTWLLVVLALVLLLPNPAGRRWDSQVPNPRFFGTNLYRSSVAPGETVLSLPYGAAGWSLYWQAEDDFRYRLVGGHFGRVTTPQESVWRDVYDSFGFRAKRVVAPSRFRAFLRTHGVDVVTVAAGTRLRVRRLVETLGVQPVRRGDVLVYRLRR
jgi:hypothetical protein